VTQSQFAGYYVAKDKGFYEEEGLDVDDQAGGPDIARSR
jgi:NitT/TauT family transport system substrate-binding protein